MTTIALITVSSIVLIALAVCAVAAFSARTVLAPGRRDAFVIWFNVSILGWLLLAPHSLRKARSRRANPEDFQPSG